MSGFLFAFIAVLVCGIGARDQVLVAALTRAQGPRPLLLVTALVAALATTAFAGWAAARLAADLAPPARSLFAAFALGIAGAEMLILRSPRAPAEPTGSLFAAFLVLAAMQITDAARFLVLAIGVATAAPLPAGLGGAAASVAALCAGWLAPDMVALRQVKVLRRAAGGLLLIVGLWLALGSLID